MTTRILLFDADGTLWDFDASAKLSFERIFERRGYPYTDEVFERYNLINDRLWECYERNEMPRDRVLVERFDLLFGELGIAADGTGFEDEFRTELEQNPFWMEGAKEVLTALRPDHRIYIVSNGVLSTQRKRIALTGLDRYVDGIFISDEIGAQKPQKAFFDHVLSRIESCPLDEMLLIGDSLSADILGANRAGIPACWFNPKGKALTGPAKPDYEIRHLSELPGLL